MTRETVNFEKMALKFVKFKKVSGKTIKFWNKVVNTLN